MPSRQAYKLSLPVDKKSVYEMNVPATLYVNNNNIVQIYPGETLYLELQMVDSIMVLTSVKEIKNPTYTITISCTQNVNKKKRENTMLKIINPFEKDVSYAAKILLMKSKQWVSTNVLQVQAGLMVFEMWPDVILSLGLADWKFIDK